MTGLDPDSDRIIEIGVVKIDAEGKVLSRWETLVSPGSTVAGRSDIHGIEGSWLAAAPSFETIAGDFASQVVGSYPISHNQEFDLGLHLDGIRTNRV
ncbi:MAG: 3'-5' exonuclease [Actinomycetota bacterium]|nr:3'-5' exonuclease [Actinomycetota bacterium]